MTSSEAARHSLYARLQEVLGPEHADTLMTSLPIDPGAELATRSDIARLEGMIEALGVELRAEIKEQQRTYLATTVGSMTALTAIFGVIVTIVV